jgi:excisionase family DNA binding protein
MASLDPLPPTGLADLTVGEAASRLGVAVDTLRRWDRSGRFPAKRTPGGQRRYDARAVEDLREARELGGTA